jgi:LuxR family maltose regulon positive regulatory protein
MVLSNIAVIQVDQGQLRKAAATFREAIRRGHAYAGRSGQSLHVTSYAYIYLADLLREWNDLESAMAMMEQGIALCTQWGEPQLLASGHVLLAKLLQSAGDVQGAREAMRKARETAGTLSAWYAERIAADYVCLLLALGDTTAASLAAASEVRAVDEDTPPTLRDCKVYRALAQVSLAQGDLDRAQRMLEQTLGTYEACSSQALVIETLAFLAVVLWKKGARAQALNALARALALAQPEGYVRTFVDRGAPMGELLRRTSARGVASYAGQLLAALEERVPANPPTARPPSAVLPLVEPLSKRELDVLRLLNTDMSSTEIAQALYISRNTARTHIAHIYEKLDVHSRADAVGRAEELGLL